MTDKCADGRKDNVVCAFVAGLLAICSIAGLLGAEVPSEGGATKEALDQAVALVKEGKKGEAADKLEEVAELAEKRSEQRYIVGVVAKLYDEMGLKDRAIQMYQRAITLFPENAVYHADLAAVYAEKGQLGKAVTLAEQAVRLDSDDPINVHSLARFYLQQGNAQKAKQALEKTVRVALAKGNTAIAKEAEQVLQRLQLLDAMSTAEQSLKGLKDGQRLPVESKTANPTIIVRDQINGVTADHVLSVSEALTYAQHLEAQGKPDQAMRFYEAILKEVPDHTEAKKHLDAAKSALKR